MQTYDVEIFDGGASAGYTTFEAETLDQAWALGEEWAKTGDWGHAGSVRLCVAGRSDGEDDTRSGQIDVGEG